MRTGQIVCSLAGSDKNTFLVVVGTDDKSLLVCDGKRYKLSKPKRKNKKHIAPMLKTLEEQELTTDKALRRALAVFRSNNDKEKSLCQKQI
ncbi:MAG: KOW domain-containing RNA-binding protein [Clostridia bacterium]|nr:KOW domain-containing RNA-binding protein [Clostridia bacterium]